MDGGVGCPPMGLGVMEAGSENLRQVGSHMGYLAAGGKAFLRCESGTIFPLITQCCFCSMASLPCWRRHAWGGGVPQHV